VRLERPPPPLFIAHRRSPYGSTSHTKLHGGGAVFWGERVSPTKTSSLVPQLLGFDEELKNLETQI